MEEPNLPRYRSSHVLRGKAEVRSGLIVSPLFSALVVHERDLEIQVPALDGPVLVMALDPRSRVQYAFDGRRRDTRFRIGMVSVMPTNLSPWWSSLDCAGRMAHLHFSDASMKDMLGDDRLALRPRPPCEDGVATRLIRLILNAANEPPFDIRSNALGIALISHLADQQKTLPQASLAQWQIQRVEEFLRTQLASDPSLLEMAKLAGLSPFHFLRCFKQALGVSPGQFLIRLRVERAAELLERTTLSISDIAARVGYDDPSHFARMFRKQFGVSPLGYRQDRRS